MRFYVINYCSIYVLLEYSNYLRSARQTIYVVYAKHVCSVILQSYLMINPRLSEISTVEVMEVPTSHLVIAGLVCSAICISTRRVQKIHFHKHLSWEKTSGTSQAYKIFLGSENGHVRRQPVALCEEQFWRIVTWNVYCFVLSWCQISGRTTTLNITQRFLVLKFLGSEAMGGDLVKLYLEYLRMFAKWLENFGLVLTDLKYTNMIHSWTDLINNSTGLIWWS